MSVELPTHVSLRDTAEQALAILQTAGFEHVQATASWTNQEELSIVQGQPSLLRSLEGRKLALSAIVDGRRASAEIDDFSVAVLRERAAQMFSQALDAPQDAANAVSSGQHADIEQGPQQADVRVLADKAAELLSFRQSQTPTMMINEGTVAHTHVRTHVCTSGGSTLASRLGWYSMNVLGAAREGGRSSSFNFASGTSHDLRAKSAPDFFGIGDMFRDTAGQIETRPLSAKFVGQLVLGPRAVADLVAWLLAQLGDLQLISGNSLYREQVGNVIASPLVSLQSRFDAPGVANISTDAFVAKPVQLLREGHLLALVPSLYGSRKTGLVHVPTATNGWEIPAGHSARVDLIAGVDHGALVGRLSMGVPAANGDFSASLKNSVELVGGQPGAALAEAMISGNIARMLGEISGVSRERIDSGMLLAPWLRIDGVQFS